MAPFILTIFLNNVKGAETLGSWQSLIYVPGGLVAHVHAIVKGSALLPCDLTPPAPNDSVVLVVWYKDEHTPIYR